MYLAGVNFSYDNNGNLINKENTSIIRKGDVIYFADYNSVRTKNPIYDRWRTSFQESVNYGVEGDLVLNTGQYYQLKYNLPNINPLTIIKSYCAINEVAPYIEDDILKFFDYSNFDTPKNLNVIHEKSINRGVGTYAQLNYLTGFNQENEDEIYRILQNSIVNENLTLEKNVCETQSIIADKEVYIEDISMFLPYLYDNPDNDDDLFSREKVAITDLLFINAAPTPYLKKLEVADNKALNDIMTASTTVVVSVVMDINEFNSIKHSTSYLYKCQPYCVFSATWQQNVAELTLVKLNSDVIERNTVIGNQEWQLANYKDSNGNEYFTFDEAIAINAQLTDGWRVPTRQDFVDLDIALGGTGQNGQNNLTLIKRYVDEWSAKFNGLSWNGTISGIGSTAFYWSQTESSADNGYHLYLYSSGSIYPQDSNNKNNGFSIRVVRDA